MNVPQRLATHRVFYEAWISCVRAWEPMHFDTTRSAIHGHFAALRVRMHAGQVRAIKVKHL